MPGGSTMALARHLRVWLLLLQALLSGAVHAQVTGAIVSFTVTNYTGWIIAGDTGGGGHQAIQTSTVMLYTNSSHILATDVFQLAYQLVDQGGSPVPILDEKGNSNVTYSVYQTNALPIIFISSFSITNHAPLQPLTRLDPYNSYMPQLKVYSGAATNNPTLTYTGTNANGYSPAAGGYLLSYLDFTNTVSPDAAPNLLAIMSAPYLGRLWSIGNSPGQSGFPVQVGVIVARYDDFTLPPHPTNTTVTLNFQLLNTSTGASVPLQASQAVFNVSIESHDAGLPPSPVSVNLSTNFSLVPAVRLDSVDNTYQIVVTLAHTEGSRVVNDRTNALAPAKLLDFSGQLYFGSLLTYFTNLDVAPTITGTVPGDHLDCLLKVSPNAGWLPGAPGQTYGDGNNLAVALLTNGTAQIKPGVVVNVQGPAVNNQTVQNISFQTYGLKLTSDGASGEVTLIFPVGFSLAAVVPNNRLTVGALTLGTNALNQNLAPATNLLTISGPLQVVEESLPFWFYASSGQWDVSSGTLTFIPTGGVFLRQTEDDLLTANQSALSDTNLANRVSNDGYFRHSAVEGSLIVTADANGMAQVSCHVVLNPPELRPHFPYSTSQPGQQIQFAGKGNFILDHGVVSAESSLPVLQPVPASYARDTRDTNCSSSLAGPAVLPFTPTSNQLGFTADGGLLASGSVPTSNLTWGYAGNGNYAQEVLNVGPCAYEMAGTFLSGGQSSLDPAQLAAALLLSGFGQGTNTAYVERLGGANYNAGLANYPGINFTAPATANSYLAGQSSGAYPLTPECKYYARYGGVSGIHDALTFPSTLSLYGYQFTFTSYRLSYLDSEVHKSLTDGAISFPSEPAGFIQQFSDMKFSGRGYLESAEVPASSGVKHLNYWNVDITPQSIEFAPLASDVCGTGQRWLVLGVETKLPFIPQKLHASLGFQPNGNLVTAADGVSGCDSRFAVPAQLSLQGPGTSSFVLSTASEGYFNNWTTPNKPASGFYNLAGKLRVPFFEDIKAHLHIMPTGGNTAQISIMGGWPAANSGATNQGWSAGTNNYFNTAKFDASAQGFPSDQHVKLAYYENSPTVQYHPVAQRNWIQVAIFDYPLQWNPALREFAGFEDGSVELPVINVSSRLKEITPGKVDFDFAQDVSLQLPRVKALDFLNDAIGELSGPLLSVSNAVQSALNTNFDTVGLNELQGALREDPTTLFQPILSSAFSNVVDQLYSQLSSFSQTDKKAFLSNAVYQVNHSALAGALSGLNGAAGQANTIVGQLDTTLTDAQGDLNLFIRILGKDGSGKRNVVSAILQQLVSDQGAALHFLPGLTVSQADSLVSGLDPTLGEIRSEFQDLSQQFAQVHASLTSGSGHFHKALNQAVGDTASVNQFVQYAANNVSNHLSRALTPAGDYFTANPAAAKQAIQRQLMNAFHSSPLSSDYQQTLRQFLFDHNAILDELMDTTFDQINDAIRDGLANLITAQNDTNYMALKNMTNCSVGCSLLSAKIRGSPTFNGDSLRKIHLNAAVQMNLPNPMNFKAYMEIKELNSQSVPVACIPAGGSAAEVTMGAKNVPLDWLALNPTGTPPLLTVGAKFTLLNGNIIGMGGLFDIVGEIGFQGCSVNEIGATLAFGATENYFAAKAAGTVTIIAVPVSVQVGVFVGSACSLDPILFIDPQASDVLGANKVQVFSGIYVAVGASLSLSEILFGSSSCLLDIGVTESVATYYEGSLDSLTLGMRQTTSVDASLLCLISASASLTMFSSATYSLPSNNFNLTLGGTADICGSIGPCPFCISGCKSVTITGRVGSGGVDYSLDY
jgi:hypothetical protein